MGPIGHQAVRVKVERRPLLLPRQQREELPAVIFGVENVLPVVPARDQMVQPAFHLDPQSPRHAVAE